jgi:hypothetical protein
VKFATEILESFVIADIFWTKQQLFGHDDRTDVNYFRSEILNIWLIKPVYKLGLPSLILTVELTLGKSIKCRCIAWEAVKSCIALAWLHTELTTPPSTTFLVPKVCCLPWYSLKSVLPSKWDKHERAWWYTKWDKMDENYKCSSSYMQLVFLNKKWFFQVSKKF